MPTQEEDRKSHLGRDPAGPEDGAADRRRPRRRMAARLLLLLASLLVAFGLCEALLRFLGITFPVFVVYDHDRGLALTPGKEGWYDREGRAYLKINSLGYRDFEHAEAKPPGVFRIALLGDSFAEARQVEIPDTFWKRLEADLNARPPTGLTFEVLNFGVGGYSTTQELLTYRLHVRAFAPDLVLLAFTTGNDVANNSRRLMQDRNDDFRPFHVFVGGELVLDNSFRDWSLAYARRRFLIAASDRFRTVEVVNQVRRVLGVRRRQEEARQAGREADEREGEEAGLSSPGYVPPRDEVWEEAWKVTEGVIGLFHQEAAQAGSRFAVVTLSSGIQVDPDPARRQAFARGLGVEDLFYPERRLRALGERLGFPVITLAERLAEAATKQSIHLHGFENTVMGQGHWNQQGHRLVAEVLAEELQARGLVR